MRTRLTVSLALLAGVVAAFTLGITGAWGAPPESPGAPIVEPASPSPTPEPPAHTGGPSESPSPSETPEPSTSSKGSSNRGTSPSPSVTPEPTRTKQPPEAAYVPRATRTHTDPPSRPVRGSTDLPAYSEEVPDPAPMAAPDPDRSVTPWSTSTQLFFLGGFGLFISGAGILWGLRLRRHG